MSESTLAVSALARAEESPAIRMIEKFFGSGGVPPPSRSEATSAINVMDSCVAAGRRLSQVHAVFEWRSDECHGHAGWRGCAAIGSGGVPPPWRSEATSAMSETNVMDSWVGSETPPLPGACRLRVEKRQMSWTRVWRRDADFPGKKPPPGTGDGFIGCEAGDAGSGRIRGMRC